MLAISTVADARFAPSEAGRYRERVTQVRDDGDAVERFTLERTIVFARSGSGWIATVTFGPAEPSATTGAGALLQRAAAALAGTTIRYRLTDDGTIGDIEDEAAQWQRFVATVAAMGGTDAARSRDAATISTALAALPDDRRREILTEPIAAILAPVEAGSGARPATKTTVPARSPLGGQTDIAATTITTETATAVRLVTEGEGPLAVDGAQPGRIRIRRSREIEKATGLLREAREETGADAVIGGKPVRQSITTTTILTYAVP